MSDEKDIYADQFNLSIGPYGVALTFSLTPSIPGPGPAGSQPTVQSIVRMSLEHAKVMAMILRKNLKQYELEMLGDSIRVPMKVLQQLNLGEDQW